MARKATNRITLDEAKKLVNEYDKAIQHLDTLTDVPTILAAKLTDVRTNLVAEKNRLMEAMAQATVAL